MPGGGHVASSQILEVNLISATDLAPVAKSMKTFAVGWIQPDRKMRTRVDPTGHNNPTWNEKLVFRVESDSFFYDASSTITIEIYSASVRSGDTLVGTVVVLVSSLFPPSSSALTSHKMRFLTLQIRRPSGRAQGVLNLGATLLEGTRRSCDLSSIGYSDLIPDPKSINNNSSNNHVKDKKSTNKIQLRHSKSARSINDFAGNKGSLCSDVGPSPSVVAAAIAMGLYPTAAPSADDRTAAESSVVLEEWTEEDDSVEGLKTKIERWRSEIHPIYETQIYRNYGRSSYRRNNAEPKRSEHRRAGSGGGLFSCFGTAYGCEFSISCGGGNRRKKLDIGDKSHLSLSEISYNDPYRV
ncbi:C2 domain containing protein [Trema orientale]|uniref:C2 domain containing protein n=1 Tax=Trema orientale TaxID=63057 RepID=A0A2P5FYQ2_TREOI|nr:C2 domain containing protein [Trema orientale]